MPTEPPSAVRAFFALVAFSFRRLGRVRQMGWVALGLLGILAVTVAVNTHGPVGWGLPNRYSWTMQTHVRDYPGALDELQMLPGSGDTLGARAAAFAPFRAILADDRFLADWAFLNFSRWVVFVMFLTFLLPMFSLAYASAALGAERESRTMIWLLTRPLPRWAVYLAKFLGALPWCLFAAGGGFAVLCLAGGEVGRRALVTYWPAVIAGTVGFAALFHLIGATFRRPAVVGLIYVFFFETLVANLPGSLKQLSLNYYAKSLLYTEAKAAVGTAVPEQLEVYSPADPLTAWLVLGGATVVLSALGMWAFGRQEPQDEV